MISVGALSFASPLVLLGLLLLPALWWLLRVTPPSPKQVRFPAIRLLLGIEPHAETAAHTPLWLLILRLVIATLLIIGLANPFWRPVTSANADGPLLLLIDNGWAGALNWDERLNAAEDRIVQAGRSNRRVAVLGTAPEPTQPLLQYETAGDALARLRALPIIPLSPSRSNAAQRITSLEEAPGEILWFSDGLDYGSGSDVLSILTGTDVPIHLFEPAPGDLATILRPPVAGEQSLTVELVRASGSGEADGDLVAYAGDGTPLARAAYAFGPADLSTPVSFNLPLQLRNEIVRVVPERNATAGNTILLDERWRRRTLGIVTGDGHTSEQPLLSDLYYLERALSPYVDIRKPRASDREGSDIADLLSEPLSLLLLADMGALSGADLDQTTEWITDGGILVRFAGPAIAAQADALIPVPLRSGGREIGGALSWTNPQRLAPFSEGSPFYGLTPPDDVLIHRQVLADPRSDLADHVWARLEDGTPLVTARRIESGWTVLVHVTANPDWSNLALSGLYVDMLRRLIELSHGTTATELAQSTQGAALPPHLTLDGRGNLVSPPPWTAALPRDADAVPTPSPRHPPGLYGPEGTARALNLTNAETALALLPSLPGLASRGPLTGEQEVPLKGLCLALALLLLLLDGLAALAATGRLTTPRLSANATGLSAIALFCLLSIAALPVQANTLDEEAERDAAALASVLETHLAYVVTGDPAVDQISHLGLASLSRELEERTSLEPGSPVGVNIERDELAFYPLIYWPITDTQPSLSDAGLARLETYMRNGGTVLFDTQDQNQTIRGLPGANQRALRSLLERVDVPLLEPVPDGHVLTKAFYLLDDFPGRWEGGPVWVEAPRSGSSAEASNRDGVSAIIIGSNDYAAAWATDAEGRPQFAAVPGGERQREIATRVGINLVMYALTGNYKADQVHVPALLERLGQ